MSQLELLGDVAAINASLNLIIGDGPVLCGYDGSGADNQRAIDFLTSSPYDQGWCGRLAIGDADGVVCSLEAMAGMASVFRTDGDCFFVIEPCRDGLQEEHEDDPGTVPADFLMRIQSALEAPANEPAIIGMLEVPSGILVFGDAYDSFAAHADEMAVLHDQPVGVVAELDAHLGSLAVRVPPGRYRISRQMLEFDWYDEIGVARVERID